MIGHPDDSTQVPTTISNRFLRILKSHRWELFHVAITNHAALYCGSALGNTLGNNSPALTVIDIRSPVF
jgi:hypothetical protein